jgi:hypothetical protein
MAGEYIALYVILYYGFSYLKEPTSNIMFG